MKQNYGPGPYGHQGGPHGYGGPPYGGNGYGNNGYMNRNSYVSETIPASLKSSLNEFNDSDKLSTVDIS